MLSKTVYNPGVIKDDTKYASAGYAVDSDKIRFVRGKVESQAGYEDQLGGVKLDGVGRSLFAWTDNQGVTHEAVGTHNKLYVVTDGAYHDITPMDSSLDGSGTVSDGGGTTLNINSTSHGLRNGSYIYANCTTAAVNVGSSGSFLISPFYVSEGNNIVIATLASHGFNSGDVVTIAGSSTFNGVTDLDGDKTIFVTDADTFTFDSSDTATATGSGGGTPTHANNEGFEITIIDGDNFSIQTPFTAFGGAPAITWLGTLPAGRIDAIRPGGYSSGSYGVDRWGYSSEAVYRSDYQPRVWSLDSIGQFLVANPLGGGVYIWELNTSNRAVLVPNAPLQNDSMLVTEEGAIMVFGTLNTDGDYDPMCVRWSDIRTSITGTTTWETWVNAPGNLAGEYRLQDGSFLVGAIKTKSGLAVWSDTSLIFSQFVQNVSLIYSFDLISTGCGLAGPNACVEKDGMVYWATLKVGFHSFNSGSPDLLSCPVRKYFVDNINTLQAYKCWTAYDAAYDGVTFAYPVGDEIDTYVRLDTKEMYDQNSGWSVGTTDKTAWIDRNPLDYPTSYRSDGMLCFEDKGRSANGAAIDRFIEYSPIEIDQEGAIDGTYVINISKVVFDATCEGDMDVELRLQRWPNGPLTTKGPFVQSSAVEYTGVRAQGRQAGFLWRSFGSDDYWRLGDIRYDISQGPRR